MVCVEMLDLIEAMFPAIIWQMASKSRQGRLPTCSATNEPMLTLVVSFQELEHLKLSCHPWLGL
jgi:hypothetical protein